MIDRKTRLRFRRNVRKGRRHVESLSIQAEDRLEKLFIRRLHRLLSVRRFVFSWMILVVFLVGISIAQLRALSPHYLVSSPASGGMYVEGIIGTFTNANPLYATGGVDGAVSRLLFSSLLTYDKNGELSGDLAANWSVNDTGKQYTVTLKEDIFWHDGEPLTAKDVVFTYNTIQNPDTRSPLFSSWRDVKVKSINDKQIMFTLPNVFAAFPHSLTNGIVPKHLLESVDADQLRSDQFNTVRPVGTGPFVWEAVEVSGQSPEERQESIALRANENYYNGSPNIQRFIIKTFKSEELMTASFMDKELNAMSGLVSISDEIEDPSLQVFNLPLSGAVMVFFKTTEGVLENKKVRQALVRAVDTNAIVDNLPHESTQVDSPFLRGQFGYESDITQLSYNVDKANKILDEAGWLKNEDGIREKDGKELRFQLKAANNSELTDVTMQLQRYWNDVGVAVDVDQPDDTELQSIVSLHQYDAVVYSISIGNDPDVFAFWHSSQADVRAANRLNLSEYQSDEADQALEAGRTRLNPSLRAVKYQPFLRQWRKDAPALALYQPRFLYVTRSYFNGFDVRTLHSINDRYNSVVDWSVRTKKVYKN